MNNYIGEVIQNKAAFLKASFQSNKLVQHQGVKGQLNELLLLQLIEELIPKNFELVSGIIQDSKGFQSNESDLVIHDTDILPAFLFGNKLGFIPAESIEYIFEIKSTLTSQELQSTLKKFKRLNECEGFLGRRTLFSFSSDLREKSELERYYNLDKECFFSNPTINLMLVEGSGYYHFSSKKVFVKDVFNRNDFVKNFVNKSCENGTPLFLNDNEFQISEGVKKVDINTDDFIVNGYKYSELFFHVYQWWGVESCDDSDVCLLAFLAGLTNTLCKKTFGSYILNGIDLEPKMYSECIVDQWGNQSHTFVDFEGNARSVLEQATISISLQEDATRNRINVSPRNTDYKY